MVLVGGHPSRPAVAGRLQRPTRRLGRAALERLRRHLLVSSWPCSGWGLPSHPGHPGCWWSLAPPFHPYPAERRAVCFLWHFPAGRPGLPLATTPPCGVRTFLGGRCPPRPPDRLVRHWPVYPASCGPWTRGVKRASGWSRGCSPVACVPAGADRRWCTVDSRFPPAGANAGRGRRSALRGCRRGGWPLGMTRRWRAVTLTSPVKITFVSARPGAEWSDSESWGCAETHWVDQGGARCVTEGLASG